MKRQTVGRGIMSKTARQCSLYPETCTMRSVTVAVSPNTNTRTESAMATRWPDMDRTGPRVDQAAVQELEAYLGVSLPDDYARFLLEVNGGRTSKSFRVFDICTHRRPNST